jgi:hypothetical protein
MKTLLLNIRRLSPALYYCGIAHLILFGLLLIAQQFDHRQLMGIDLWIKPAKFAISIAIYSLTWPLLLQYFPFEQVKKRYVNFTVFALSFEMLCIASQAARGQLSHFNIHGTYNMVVFSLMGIIISLQTLFALYIGLLFFKVKAGEISDSVLWGIRLGILMAGLFAFEGGYMAARLSHTVGAADGGAGLPVVNWSTVAGDLRIAHFMGLHALQVLPLFALLLSRRNTGATFVFSAFYFLAFPGCYIWPCRDAL